MSAIQQALAMSVFHISVISNLRLLHSITSLRSVLQQQIITVAIPYISNKNYMGRRIDHCIALFTLTLGPEWSTHHSSLIGTIDR